MIAQVLDKQGRELDVYIRGDKVNFIYNMNLVGSKSIREIKGTTGEMRVGNYMVGKKSVEEIQKNLRELSYG